MRYLLQGSVRRSGARVRVNAQLIDAESDAHLWVERFDYATDDLFALQDEVTSRIAVALNLELVDAEAARPAEDPDAFDYMLRGRAALYKGPTAENFAAAINLLEEALALDPASFHAKALLANALASRALDQLTDSVPADLERADRLLAEALAASSRHALAHFAKGQVLRARYQFKMAISEYETVIALDRNSVWALAALGLCRLFTGDVDQVIPALERAIRLSPRDPNIANRYLPIGMVHLVESRTDEAILWLERARSANPRLAGPHAWLASAHALKGDLEGATAELAEARRLSRDNRYASIGRHKSIQALGSPQTHALFETTFYAGLRKAGVPEE